MIRKFVFLLVLAMSPAWAGAPTAALHPAPKEVRYLPSPAVALRSPAIVIGANAPEPEQYAAERLRSWVLKRYGVEWPVVRDSADLKAYASLIVLGQQSTNKLVASSCRDLKINANEQFPVPDGYALAVGGSGGKAVAVVAGSNPRSVIYGADTLYQLIARQNDGLAMTPVVIRDWPSLAHRGRPCTTPDYASSTEVLDAAALGRLNFIDIRYGIYGTSFSANLDHEKIKLAIREAHRRGLLVYGTVSLVAQEADYDKVIAKFQEFIDLGVDGLWPYIGDPGGYGRGGTPIALLERVLALGKKHGMTGDLIHFTPGKRGYVNITNPDNYAAAKAPGMDDVLWFFAVKPTPQSFADAASLGLKKKYVWWDHWPHPKGGFSSCGNVGFRFEKPNVFADIHALQEAYQRPTPEELAKAPEIISGVHPWGGTVWLQECILGPIGWWAWSPEKHDWQQTRRRIYDYLYGPDMLDTAFEFNDLYNELRSKMIMCDESDESAGKQYIWPPLRKEGSNPAECQAIIAKMYPALEKLRAGAAKGTMRDIDTLEKYFFEPAGVELNAAKVVVELPRVDYWWEANQARILMAIREGNATQALRWQADAEKRAKDDIAKAQAMLAGVVSAGGLGAKWDSEFDKLAGEARPVSAKVTLDGELIEPAWSAAPKLGPFRICNDADPFETKSEARVLYSDDALYVGFTFGEPDMNLLLATSTAHDSAVAQEDSFEIYINTDGLRTPYYRFVANALGTKFESLCGADGVIDDKWDGEWEVKTSRKADGWTAEVRIPYTTLGTTKPVADTLWLCNFARNDRAQPKRLELNAGFNEMSSWGYRPRGQVVDPQKFRPIWFK